MLLQVATHPVGLSVMIPLPNLPLSLHEVVVVSSVVEGLLSAVTVVLDCGGTVTAEAVAVDEDETAEDDLGR